MKFGFIPSCIEVSPIDACFSYNWKLFFPSPELCCLAWLHIFVPMLSILCQDAFQKSSLKNTERSDQSNWSNTEDSSERIFPSVKDALTSLFVPLHNWRLSSVTVHCSSSAKDPSVLGSTSTCLVSLIDFKSSGVALVTTPLLLVHFFCSNPCCEKRSFSWLKTSIASSGVCTDFMKSTM